MNAHAAGDERREHHLGRLASLVLVAAIATAAAGRAAADDAADDVIVMVGDAPITRADLSAFQQRFGNGRQQIAGRRHPLAPAAALERLVDERLLRMAVAREGIRIDPAQVAAAVDRLREQLPATRGVSLDTLLKQSGRDEASLRLQIELDLAVQKLIAPRIDAAALAAAFAQHRRDIDGTRVRVSHLVVRPDMGTGDGALAAAVARATEIRAAIVRGAITFADAASRHSAGPSHHRGGDLGYLPRHSEINEAFAREAFALGVGDVSQPFETPFGIHIVTVTEVEPGTATLETLRPQVEQLAAQQAIREVVAELRSSTPITYSTGVPHPADHPDGGGQSSPALPARGRGDDSGGG